MKWFHDMRVFLRTFAVSYALHLIQLQGTTALPSITISPKYAHINSSGTVTVTCNAGQSLAACQFKRDELTIDLSQGPNSSAKSNKYIGTGLHNGDCGIEMSGFTKESAYHIGCRVRAEQGGWVYATMTTLMYNDVQRLYFDSDPPGDALVLPGQNLTLIHRLKDPTRNALTTCRFAVPNMSAVKNVYFGVEAGNSSKSNDTAYYGAGLGRGECGIQLLSVSDKLNGFRSATFSVASVKGYAHPTASIIVAKPPASSVITIDKTIYTEGETLTAKCKVGKSRPVANITWYLGDDIIRSDKDNEAPISNIWKWSFDLQTIYQTISRKMTLGDNGKRLTCQTQHLAIQNGGSINESKIIAVKYKQGDNTKTVQQTDVVVGRTASVNVKTSSISKPTVFWVFGDNILKDGEADSTGHFHAATPVNVNGKWMTQLMISNVTLSDVEREYRVIAETPPESREEFIVTLSIQKSNINDDNIMMTTTDSENTPPGQIINNNVFWEDFCSDGQFCFFIGVGLAAYALLVTTCLVAALCRKRRIAPTEGRVKYDASADNIHIYDDAGPQWLANDGDPQYSEIGEKVRNTAGRKNLKKTVADSEIYDDVMQKPADDMDAPEYFEVDENIVRVTAGRKIRQSTVAESDIYDDIGTRH